jgi:kynurenine formamidase
MIVRLSHRLDDSQPNWPGAPGLRLEPQHRMDCGDIANTHLLTIYSHYGSHVDLPYHFIPGGARMASYDVDDFVFTAPLLLTLPLGDEQLVTAEMIYAERGRVERPDLVLIRSGFEAHRGDRARYVQHGPGFSEAAARAIRSQWPTARAIGVDWLSLCAVAHVEDGVGAHRSLLGPDAEGRSVLIFEDLHLAALGGRLPRRVWAMPLLVDQLDGAPCTVVAEV